MAVYYTTMRGQKQSDSLHSGEYKEHPDEDEEDPDCKTVYFLYDIKVAKWSFSTANFPEVGS